MREETRLKSQAKVDNLPLDSAFAVGRGASSRPQFQCSNTSSLTCHFCHEIGHIQPHCKKKNYCIYCKQKGHIVLECKQLARRDKSASHSAVGMTSGSGSHSDGVKTSYAVDCAIPSSHSIAPSGPPPLTHDDVRRLVAEALKDALLSR
ncbi:hypothetical protein LINGRAHAP2_LOCUS20269 [Linum grandiflorum]